LGNLPVLRLARRLDDLADAAAIAAAMDRERHLRSIEPGQATAVVLPSLREADWDAVVRLAGDLADAADRTQLAAPWVFAMADNFGRLLGGTIAAVRPHQPLVVIDEIDVGDADYLDIGRPVERFRTVIPVVAKSLIFEK
jgi:ethanolamine utilization protein EutA